MNRSRMTFAAICLIAGCQTDAPDSEFLGVDPQLAPNIVGKADGAPEFSVIAGNPYDRVILRGSAAVDLYDVMGRAGGFDQLRRGGLEYRYGFFSLCVSNGVDAACQIFSRQVELENPNFPLTLHGPRFDSAASELFGALARASGQAPTAVSVADSARFVCGKTSTDVWCGLQPEQGSTLELAFDGLEDLGPDFVYEGWLITDDGPITSGRFEVTGPGSQTFDIDADLAERSAMFVLTIEPRVDPDPGPAQTHVLAGAFEAGLAILEVGHPAALGDDFAGAGGGYILETPSTAGIADDYDQGVWFLDPAGGPAAGLRLPELPAGWAYEGWVVGEDGPVSTGVFVDPSSADRDGGGPTAGPDGTPPFPGQDFIDPARNLVGSAVVISVEPSPDNGPSPFAIKPLMGEVAGAGPGVFQTLGNISADTNPTGVATLR